MKKKLSIVVNGLIKENPVLVLVLGTCPTLATSTTMLNGMSMGLAATFVLICSNFVISLLKKVIPDKVRIPCYIVVVAGFVTVVQLLMQAYARELYKTLGLFIPLIVVNCIILGRAEMFASKNNPIDSALDGLGMGLGFTLALSLMGFIRELLGSGTILGHNVLVGGLEPITIMQMAPGGFLTFGILIAIINKLTKGKGVKKKSFECECCPQRGACAGADKEVTPNG